MARTIAAMIPGFALRSITFCAVSHLVAPKDREAALSSAGIVLSTSTIILIIIGKIITDNTMPPAKIVYPEVETPNKGAM
ncbi:hypothetical protein D3C81_2212340 [compost metagenome]